MIELQSEPFKGHVVIHSLASQEAYSFDKKRPLRTVALEPNFSKRGTRAFVCGGMAGTLVLHEKGWLGHKETVIHANEGPIWTARWRGTLIAWANDMVRPNPLSSNATLLSTNTSRVLKSTTPHLKHVSRILTGLPIALAPIYSNVHCSGRTIQLSSSHGLISSKWLGSEHVLVTLRLPAAEILPPRANPRLELKPYLLLWLKSHLS